MPNVTNGVCIPLFTATSRFCGFPIGLITLPVVIAIARERSISFGEIRNFAGKPENQRCPDDRKCIIHEECGKETHPEQYEKYHLIRRAGMGKKAAGKHGKVPALHHCFTYDEHSQQKKHHIDINRTQCIGQRYLPGQDGRPGLRRA